MSRPLLASFLFALVPLSAMPMAAPPVAPGAKAPVPGAKPGTRHAELAQKLRASELDLASAKKKLDAVAGPRKLLAQELEAAKQTQADAQKLLAGADEELKKREQALATAKADSTRAQTEETTAASKLTEASRKVESQKTVLATAQRQLSIAEKAQMGAAQPPPPPTKPEAPAGTAPAQSAPVGSDPATAKVMQEFTLPQLLNARISRERELQDKEQAKIQADKKVERLKALLQFAESKLTAAKNEYAKDPSSEKKNRLDKAQNEYDDAAKAVTDEDGRAKPVLAAFESKAAELKIADKTWEAGVAALGTPPNLGLILGEWREKRAAHEQSRTALAQATQDRETASAAVAAAQAALMKAEAADTKKLSEELATAKKNLTTAESKLKVAQADWDKTAGALAQKEHQLANEAKDRKVLVAVPAQPSPGAVSPMTAAGKEMPAAPAQKEMPKAAAAPAAPDLAPLRTEVENEKARLLTLEEAKNAARVELEKRQQEAVAAKKKVDSAQAALQMQQTEVTQRKAAVQRAEQAVQALQAKLGPVDGPLQMAEADVRRWETVVARLQAEKDALSGKRSSWEVAPTSIPVGKDATTAIVWGDPADPAKREVLVASMDGTVRRGEPGGVTGRVLFDPEPVLAQKGEQFFGLARRGDQIAIGTGDGQVIIQSTAGGTPKTTFRKGPGADMYVRALAFHPKHPEILAVGSRDGEVELWDTTKPGTKLAFVSLKRTILSVSFSPDGKLLAVGTRAAAGSEKLPTALLYQVSDDGRKLDKNEIPLAHPDQVNCVAFHPTRPELITACADGRTRWYRTLQGEASKPVEIVSLTTKSPETSVLSATFGGADGNYLLTGDTDGWLKLFDLAPAVADPNGFPVLLAEKKVHGGKVFTTALGVGTDPNKPVALSGGVDLFVGISIFSQKEKAPAAPADNAGS